MNENMLQDIIDKMQNGEHVEVELFWNADFEQRLNEVADALCEQGTDFVVCDPEDWGYCIATADGGAVTFWAEPPLKS